MRPAKEVRVGDRIVWQGRNYTVCRTEGVRGKVRLTLRTHPAKKARTIQCGPAVEIHVVGQRCGL